MSDEIRKPLATPRKSPVTCPENRVPGQIVEKLATGVEYFDQYPPTEQKDFVLEVIRVCAAQGLMFLTSEFAEERFKATDGKQYVRYVIDISIATRAGYIWGRTFRHSITVLFAGIDTSYRAKKRVMRDFFSLLFGVELPPEQEHVHRAPPTGPACTGKESAARKFQLLEAIERTDTPTSLKQLLEDNRKEMDWLWRADRAEVATKAKQRAKKLTPTAHRPETANEAAT
ncbi:MAG: hypothetical protein L3J67_12280 [Hyphomicrobiaceae bacterium]|nr:hypothetical protein [Hyphomicrobiaceae bacterium]